MRSFTRGDFTTRIETRFLKHPENTKAFSCSQRIAPGSKKIAEYLCDNERGSLKSIDSLKNCFVPVKKDDGESHEKLNDNGLKNLFEELVKEAEEEPEDESKETVQ